MVELPPRLEESLNDPRLLAGRIQHTLISNCVTRTRWEQHIRECLQYRFNAAMVPPSWVKVTRMALAGSGIRTASWIDFPWKSVV